MRTATLALALMSASALTPSVHAQDSAGSRLAVEEIIVTARKRDESIYQIPVSVSAFSQVQLDAAGISSPEDLAHYTAGFDFATNTGTSGRTNPDIRFRGQIQQVNTPSTQVGAVFWDGSFMSSGSGFVPFGDLERVEVIKGPQTAHFGRNTFSGAINYIPKLPGDVWSGKVDLGYSPSQFDSYKISGAVGGPVTDKVGVRVYLGYDVKGGDFAYGDGTPLGRTMDTSTSGTITFKPTDSLRFKLTGYYTRAKDTEGIASLAATTPAGQCRKTVSGNYADVLTGKLTPFTRDLSTLTIATFCGTIPRANNLVVPITRTPTTAQVAGGAATALLPDTTINPYLQKYGFILPPYNGGFGGNNQTMRVQASMEYDLPAEHVFSFMASRAETGVTNVQDGGFGAGVSGTTRIVTPSGNSRLVSELYYEGRVTSPATERLRYLFGVSQYYQHYRNGASPTANTLDFQNNRTFGVFASADYDITKDLTLSFEGRYAYERSRVIINGNPLVGCGLITVCNLTDDDKSFIPRVILTYRPFDGATTYASFSTGSLLGVQTQAGFISSVAPSVIPDPTQFGIFTPTQKNTTYEIGWKQKGSLWSFTLASYYTKWENQPFASVIVLPVGSSSFRGPGSSDTWGVEFEGAADPTDWLSVVGTVGWTHARLTSYLARGTVETAILNSGNLSVSSSGLRPRYVPNWTGSIGPTIHGTIGKRAWFVRADVLYEGGFYVDFDQLDYNPGAAKVNLRAGLDITPKSTIEVYVSNLTDNKRVLPGSTTTGPGGNRIVFTEAYQRREFGVRARAEF